MFRSVSTMLVLVMLLSLPGLSFGAEAWEDTLQDLEMWEDSNEQDELDIIEQEEDAEVDSAEELFPVGDDEESTTVEESKTHLTVKIDGVPVLFADVPLFQWFAPYVRDVAERSIVSGYRDSEGIPTGAFGPADNVTIEQLTKMSVQAAGIDTFDCGSTLRNTTVQGSWSERYVRCAEHHGWVVFSDGSVFVNRSASRAEVVVTVLQAFGARISPRTGSVFTDVTTSTEFGAAVESAARDNIVSGYSDSAGNSTGRFGPTDPVNRAETAKMFSLAFQVYGESN